MAANNPQDPGDVFRDLVTRWERDFNAFANKVMGTEEYSKAMNQAQKAQLGVQQMFSDGMSRQLAALNLPSRDDVVRLGEALQDIARRLDRIEAQLTGPTSEETQASPPRTKRPPADYVAADQPAERKS